jgi:hypothetical protein
MDTKNSNIKTNKKINEIFEKTKNTTKEYYFKIKETLNKTPLQIKLINILVPLTLTYVFTVMYYNLFLSIFFSMLTFLVISIINIQFGMLYLILYIAILISSSTKNKLILGTPIKELDLSFNKKAFNCANNGLIIDKNLLPKDLQGGYFSYSFWIYINNKENKDEKINTWNNFRYNEWKSVFYRGTPITKPSNDLDVDLNNLIQYPGIWLTPVLNNLVIVFQSSGFVERLEITNVPFNKWINYIIVLEQKSVSIYIDGLLDRTLNLYQSVNTDINLNNIYVSGDRYLSKNKNQSGFPGNLAQFVYYNYAIKPIDIQKSYIYYKKIIDNYQLYQDSKETFKYKISNLITNSDVTKNIN